MKDFFKKYHQGVWWYRTTSYDFPFDPIEVQKDLGLTYATLPEHIHYGKTGKEEANLDKYINKAYELGMPTLYIDRAFYHNRAWAKPGLEKARNRLKLIKEQYGDKIGGIYIVDEPWWGRSDEHKAMDNCKLYNDMIREEAPEYWSYIALLGLHDRYKQAKIDLEDYVNTVHPDFLLYNVYSQMMAEDFEREQGIAWFYHNLYVFTEIGKKYGIPVWASPMCSSCWMFRKPSQEDYRWQLNVMAAHGIKGFVWYHLQETAIHPSQGVAGSPLDGFNQKSPYYYWFQHEIKSFQRCVAEKLEDFELQEVYHWMFRYGNYKAWEYAEDEYIEDVRSVYNRHLIISRFADKDGRQRVMIVNGDQTRNGNFSIKFKGDYAKYNVSNESGYLAPGGMRIIDLFDAPADPADYIPD